MKTQSVIPKHINEQIGTFDFPQIVAYDKNTNLKFVIDSSLDGNSGGIILQSPYMREVLKRSQTASQTDSGKGFCMIRVYQVLTWPSTPLSVTYVRNGYRLCLVFCLGKLQIIIRDFSNVY